MPKNMWRTINGAVLPFLWLLATAASEVKNGEAVRFDYAASDSRESTVIVRAPGSTTEAPDTSTTSSSSLIFPNDIDDKVEAERPRSPKQYEKGKYTHYICINCKYRICFQIATGYCREGDGSPFLRSAIPFL